jgi:hypothetical protein
MKAIILLGCLCMAVTANAYDRDDGALHGNLFFFDGGASRYPISAAECHTADEFGYSVIQEAEKGYFLLGSQEVRMKPAILKTRAHMKPGWVGTWKKSGFKPVKMRFTGEVNVKGTPVTLWTDCEKP